MGVKNTVVHKVVKGALRLTMKWPSRLPLPIGMLRAGMDAGAGLLPLRHGVEVEALELGGVPTERVTISGMANFAILHLHGGGFMLGSPASHRALASELAARTGAQVYVPDYRLAPEHPCPAAIDDCLAAWQGLLDTGFTADKILVSGDSAGGALALALSQHLCAAGKAQPAALVLMSPYVDSTLAAASIRSHGGRDPMLTRQFLKLGSDGYRGELAAADPRVSPLFGELAGLPPMLVQAGTEEILHDDACALVKHCEAAGVQVNCHLYAGMWHDFQLFSSFVDEANIALDEIARFVQSHVS